MKHAGIAAAVVLALAITATAQVKITVERNTARAATSAFKFQNVPSPAKDNAASRAKLLLVAGEADANGADLTALTDGVLPSSEDDPEANFFFNAGTLGGRFRMDFGSPIEIAQVNSYSWHSDSRAPQVYLLYASDGAAPNFCGEPRGKTDLTTCGWKLVAFVDTRPKQGNSGGQYGVSITDASGSLGKYRYLLFDCAETENDDAFGNTFYSEIDVIAKK